MLPRIFQPNEIVIKKGSLIRLKFIKGEKITIICGGESFKNNGYLKKVEKYLGTSEIQLSLIEGVVGEPTEKSVNAIADKLKKSDADWIIGIGGGAVMDTAKISRWLYENQKVMLSDFYSHQSVSEFKQKSKLCLIPTTAGSGAEVSNSSIVIIDGKKTPFVSSSLVPNLVILDAVLTTSLPSKITAYTALDALTHGIESYCSTLSNNLTDSLAISGSALIINNLEHVLSNPSDVDGREKLLYGAMLNGMAQSVTSVGGVHAISHTMASQSELSHGHLNSIVLVPVLRFNMKESDRIVDILNRLGFDGIEDFEGFVLRVFLESGISNKWNLTSKEIDLAQVSEEILTDVCARTNPRQLTLDGIRSILESTS